MYEYFGQERLQIKVILTVSAEQNTLTLVNGRKVK